MKLPKALTRQGCWFEVTQRPHQKRLGGEATQSTHKTRLLLKPSKALNRQGCWWRCSKHSSDKAVGEVTQSTHWTRLLVMSPKALTGQGCWWHHPKHTSDKAVGDVPQSTDQTSLVVKSPKALTGQGCRWSHPKHSPVMIVGDVTQSTYRTRLLVKSPKALSGQGSWWHHPKHSPDKALFCTASICCRHSSISSCSFSMSSVGTRATLVRLGVSRVGGLSDLSSSGQRSHHWQKHKEAQQNLSGTNRLQTNISIPMHWCNQTSDWHK